MLINFVACFQDYLLSQDFFYFLSSSLFLK